MLRIIAAFDLLPGGLPAGATIFLPNNDATAQLSAMLDLPFPASYIIDAANALGPQMKQKLVSLLAYHICTEAPLTAAELHERDGLTTALSGAALLATQTPAGGTLLTDTSGTQSSVVAGPAPDALDSCGVAVYVLDKILMPAADLGGLPRTTVAQAQGALGVGAAPGLAPAAAPGPA